METKRIVITFAPHAKKWFQDVAIAAARSLKELGHSCNVIAATRIDAFNSDPYDIVLVLAPHTFTECNMTPNFVKAPDKIYAGWCLEQTPYVTKTCPIMDQHWQRALKYIDKFDFFFTEAQSKADYMIKKGRQVFVLNVGYHKHFTVYDQQLEAVQKQYDVFFVGAMLPRRARIIQRLRELGLKIYPSTGNMFDAAAKANAAKICKLGLNIHHNEIGYFEKPRIIADYMANKIPVITETIEYPEGFVNGKHWIMTDYNNLVSTVASWCTKSDQKRGDLAQNAFDYIKKHYTMASAMAGFIETVIYNHNRRIRTFSGERMVPSASGNANEVQHRNRYEFFQNLAINKTVLDVGCGVGYGTNLLSMVASKAFGVDIDDAAIAHARSSYMLPKFGKSDIMALPYGRNVFDTVYCFEVIEHVSDYKRALLEFKRVLKPGGQLIISTPNKRIVSGGKDIPKNEFHIKEWNLEDFVVELKQYFRQVLTYGQPDKEPWPVRYEARADDLLYICVCTL